MLPVPATAGWVSSPSYCKVASLSGYCTNFDQLLKVGVWVHIYQIPYVQHVGEEGVKLQWMEVKKARTEPEKEEIWGGGHIRREGRCHGGASRKSWQISAQRASGTKQIKLKSQRVMTDLELKIVYNAFINHQKRTFLTSFFINSL